jgi:hypothetical protein
MAAVFPPEKVLEISTAMTLRKERAQVASEALSRRDDTNVTRSDREDDIFTFKTPCCNIAWEADACMAVQCPGCERRFCQLCSRRMEKGMTSLQAHDHVRQCTFETFNRAFVFPYEIDKKILPKKAVHLAMKANYSKLYQLQNFGEERLQHWNLAPNDEGRDHVDVTAMTHAERREALEVKISDVIGNPVGDMANANYNLRWDELEARQAHRAVAAGAVAAGGPHVAWPPLPDVGVAGNIVVDSEDDDSDDDSDSDSDAGHVGVDNNLGDESGMSGSDDAESDGELNETFEEAARRAPRAIRGAVENGRVAGALRVAADAQARRVIREHEAPEAPEAHEAPEDFEAPEAPEAHDEGQDDIDMNIRAIEAAVAQTQVANRLMQDRLAANRLARERMIEDRL